MCGSTPTTSTIATRARSSWRRSWTVWPTGTSCPRTSRRPSSSGLFGPTRSAPLGLAGGRVCRLLGGRGIRGGHGFSLSVFAVPGWLVLRLLHARTPAWKAVFEDVHGQRDRGLSWGRRSGRRGRRSLPPSGSPHGQGRLHRERRHQVSLP